MEMEQVHSAMRTLLNMLGDYRNLTLNVIHRLTSLTQLFPNTFNEKLCDQLLVSVAIDRLSYYSTNFFYGWLLQCNATLRNFNPAKLNF